MFAKLATLAFAVPYVAALTINAIQGATTGGSVTISWTATTTDPSSFSILMVNTVFHNTFAIANNVQTAQGVIGLTLPQVPVGDGYTIEAIANNDVNTVYSQSGEFSVGAATSSSATGTPSSSTSDSTSSGTTSASLVTLSTLTAATTTTPVSSASASVSVASSSTASATPSSFKSSGAASYKLIGAAPAAALVLSAVAGAVMVF